MADGNVSLKWWTQDTELCLIFKKLNPSEFVEFFKSKIECPGCDHELKKKQEIIFTKGSKIRKISRS